ncbi:MAG: class I SAM-dependent rRNA methyltransferase [Planctomycetota bacterium]
MVAKVLLKPRMAKPFWCGEPWVFEGSVDRLKGVRDLAEGDVVEVCDEAGRLVGRGFWSGKSPIRVRMLTVGDEPADDDLLRRRLRTAVALRREILRLDERNDVYRLCHAEGDGLPGLVVDRIGDHLVVQFDHAGPLRRSEVILDELEALCAPVGIFRRISRVAREQEKLEGDEGLLRGREPEGPVEVREEGVRHLVDFARGQKSGFYADQRENRRCFARYCEGRDVLDAFSYTGAFGLAALVHGGARSVVAVDSSEPALETAQASAALNGVTDRFTAERANVLRFLDHARKEGGRRWGAVSLDPPKLVPKRSALRKGLRLYREINAKGMAVVEEGGLLATCSCSQAVDEESFSAMIAEAAREVGRTVQLLEAAGPGADHPATVPHLASRYLKFRLYRVL